MNERQVARGGVSRRLEQCEKACCQGIQSVQEFSLQRQRGSPVAVPSGIFKVVLKGNRLGLTKNRQGLDVKNKMSGVSAAQSL